MSERLVLTPSKFGWTVESLWRGGHPNQDLCPLCGESVMHTGLTDLLYTFKACICDDVTYAHLVERGWHAECYLDKVTRPERGLNEG